MRHARSPGIVIGFACSCCLTAVGHAQEKLPSPSPSRPQPAVNRAAEALRREAEADIKRRENEFARLKAHPAPPLEVEHVAIKIGDARRAAIPFPVNGRVVQGARLRLLFVPVPARDDVLGDAVPPERRVVVAPETFNLFVFGSLEDPPPARRRLETLLTQRVDAAVRMSRISEVQKRKLLLAGRGDIKRLLDRVEDERKTFESLRTDPTRCEEFLLGLRSLTPLIRRPFGPESLFGKTLKKLLAEVNLVRREAVR